MRTVQFLAIFFCSFSNVSSLIGETCADQMHNGRIKKLLEASTIWYNRDSNEYSEKKKQSAKKKVKKFYNSYVYAYDKLTNLIDEEVAEYLNKINTEGVVLDLCCQFSDYYSYYQINKLFINKKNGILEIDLILNAAKERSAKVIEAKNIRENKKKNWHMKANNIIKDDEVTISAREYQDLITMKSKLQSLQSTLQEFKDDDNEEKNAQSRM